MRAIFFLLLFFPLSASAARTALSYINAHNFRLSSAQDPAAWFCFGPEEEEHQWTVGAFFSRSREVPGLYRDIKSKSETRIQNRLAESYGTTFDGAAKAFIRWRRGPFTQSFSVNAAASLLVNDPVFPDLSGIVYNDYALATAYYFQIPAEIELRPLLSYGWRRVMSHSFSVGKLLGEKPNLKIKTYPYRFFSELGLRASRSFATGDVRIEARALPLRTAGYDYWEIETAYRSPDLGLLHGLYLWASVTPLYGGLYDFGHGVKLGTTVHWWRFLRTDLFLMHGFQVGAIVRLGPPSLNAELYSFGRAEDRGRVYQSRQTGLAVNAAL